MDGAERQNLRIEYLARTAYRTHRAWAETPAKTPILFEQLPEKIQQAWREVAAAVWQEIWTDARPPVMPTPAPRPREANRLSWADKLHEDD